MTSKQPVFLWLTVVLLLLAGGTLMWAIQRLGSEMGASPSVAAVAPTKGGTHTGVAGSGVEVSTLRDAITRGDWAALKGEITQKKVDPNAQMQLMEGSRRQMSMLAFAAMHGSVNGVKELLGVGAEPDVADSAGITPLMLASAKGDAAIVKALLEAKARVEIRNKWGQTALMMAAQAGESDVVTLLLSAGANAKAVDEEGSSVLARATGGDSSVATLKSLITAGADVDAANNEGVTPLMRAAERGDAEKAVLLLNSGAKPELKDKDGRRAIDWAQQRSDDAGAKVAEVLAKAKK